MRLRTFTAPNMAEAIRLAKTALGPEAVILSTRRVGSVIQLTAALEPDASHGAQSPSEASPLQPDRIADGVVKALSVHGVPSDIIASLSAIMDDLSPEEPKQALNAALRARFEFRPIYAKSTKGALLLVGLPGAGKTSAAAKLAAMAKSAGRGTTLVTCDLAKAGAVEQLAIYARALGATAYRAKDGPSLRRAIERADKDDLVLVDSVGSNPFDAAERDALLTLAQAAGAEPVLVMSCGGDPAEAGELAQCFGEIGVKRMIATKLDVSRRLGGILAAAEGGRMAFACFGASPEIASGLRLAEAPFLSTRLLRNEKIFASRRGAPGSGVAS
jgi:flagellar biosynthesis protein FlhF